MSQENLSYLDFLQTVTDNEGELLTTIAGHATYRVARVDGGVRFIPESSGKGRTVNAGGIQKYLDAFNETHSLDTKHYSKKLFNKSYVLGVLSLWSGQKQAETTVPSDADPDEGFSTKEGKLLVRSHLSRERSSELVRIAKSVFRNRHGKLYCEVCGFSFEHTYGDSEFIEAHHRIPLRDLTTEVLTKPSDLAMVCANCHRMLHRGDPWPTIAELRRIIRRA